MNDVSFHFEKLQKEEQATSKVSRVPEIVKDKSRYQWNTKQTIDKINKAKIGSLEHIYKINL